MSYIRTFEDFSPPKRFDGVPFTSVVIQESATQTGTYADIDTQNLTPVDTDPSDPELRNLTTDDAAENPGWYILLWTDGVGATFASDPIFSGDTISAAWQVRVGTGDTDSEAQLLSDEEVASLIEQATVNDEVDVALATALAADAIAAKLSRQVDFTTDGQSFSLSQRAAAYRQLAVSLRRRGGGSYSVFTPSSINAAMIDADDLPDFGE